ncbi:MAG: CHC2 zinc finger domain-containing protein, partial [SAR324 cluster bacterium]|nr:CHC2 zinc finger domain-containing protein [SAR324 cluster bacterium]
MTVTLDTSFEQAKQKAKAVPIADILQRLGIKPAAESHKWECPFHGGSDSLHEYGDKFKCFGCGVSGDGIELVERAENLKFIDAVEWIINEDIQKDFKGTQKGRFQRKRKGYAQPPTPTPTTPTPTPTSDTTEIYDLLIASCLDQDQTAGHEYLRSRGIDPDWAWEKFCVVWIDDPKKTEHFLKGHNIEKADLERAGLINSKGNFLYWQPVLVFPFFNSDNRPVYLEGHIRKQDRKGKQKSIALAGKIPRPLWGLDQITGFTTAHLTEGIIDALSLMVILEVSNVVAITGAAAFKAEQGSSLSSLDELVVLTDTDDAGMKLKTD